MILDLETQEEAIICQLCREPIWNFLCVDCIGSNVQKWLPPKYSQQFTKFHEYLKNHFNTTIPDNYEPCIDCGKFNESPLCPYCYTHEVYHWINPQNPDMARNFSKIFFFYPFEGTEQIKIDSSPITETKNLMQADGLCDSCNEYSETLAKSREGLSCEGCREE